MLRPYQNQAIDEIRRLIYVDGQRNVLLHLAQGSGKTVIFCYILKAMYQNEKSAVMMVKGRQLVEQASWRLARESVPHGVHMAGHYRYRPAEKIQVCSIDTLISRAQRPKADLIIIDEAHMATTKGYKSVLSNYDAPILHVTATPYNLAPMSTVRPIDMQGLIDIGFLVPARYFCPAIPNLKGVHTVGDDYNQQQLAKAIDRGDLIADIVETWKTHGQDRPSMAFAVNVLHSKHIAARFCDAGIPWKHCDANTPDSERADIIEEHRLGKIKGISHVNIFSTGVDIPWLSCLIMARPTKSKILYHQQGGRGTRIAENKKDFLLLDHAGNVLRHGFLEEENGLVKTKANNTGENVKGIRICSQCFSAYRGTACKACGNVGTVNTGIKKEKEGELREIQETEEGKIYRKLRAVAAEKGYKRGWIFYRLAEKLGQEAAEKMMPKRKIPRHIQVKLLEAQLEKFTH